MASSVSTWPPGPGILEKGRAGNKSPHPWNCPNRPRFVFVGFSFRISSGFFSFRKHSKTFHGSNTSKNGFPLDANANLKVCEFAKANPKEGPKTASNQKGFLLLIWDVSGRFVEVQILAGPLDSIATKTAPGVAEAGLAPGINRQPKLGGSNSLRWTACSWKNCLHLIKTTHWTSKMVSEDEGELL